MGKHGQRTYHLNVSQKISCSFSNFDNFVFRIWCLHVSPLLLHCFPITYYVYVLGLLHQLTFPHYTPQIEAAFCRTLPLTNRSTRFGDTPNFVPKMLRTKTYYIIILLKRQCPFPGTLPGIPGRLAFAAAPPRGVPRASQRARRPCLWSKKRAASRKQALLAFAPRAQANTPEKCTCIIHYVDCVSKVSQTMSSGRRIVSSPWKNSLRAFKRVWILQALTSKVSRFIRCNKVLEQLGKLFAIRLSFLLPSTWFGFLSKERNIKNGEKKKERVPWFVVENRCVVTNWWNSAKGETGTAAKHKHHRERMTMWVVQMQNWHMTHPFKSGTHSLPFLLHHKCYVVTWSIARTIENDMQKDKSFTIRGVSKNTGAKLSSIRTNVHISIGLDESFSQNRWSTTPHINRSKKSWSTTP